MPGLDGQREQAVPGLLGKQSWEFIKGKKVGKILKLAFFLGRDLGHHFLVLINFIINY